MFRNLGGDAFHLALDFGERLVCHAGQLGWGDVDAAETTAALLQVPVGVSADREGEQELLLRREVFFAYQGGVGAFTTYFLGNKPEITKDFVVNDNVMKTFRGYLDKEKIPYTEDDMAQNLGWIKREIRKEAFISVFGLTEGFKVELEEDVQLQRAVESLPQARALYENARKIIAQRASGTGPQQQ